MRVALSLLLILIALPFVVSGQAYAQSGGCYAPKTQMRFRPVVSKTQYNISESVSTINSFAGGGHGGLVLGLAHAPVTFDYEALFRLAKNEKGYCLSFDKMKMYWRAQPFVLISGEFPRGSCEFNAVLFHENKHVRVLRRVHAKHAAGFKKHVEDSLERVRVIGPVSKDQIPAAQKKMKADFSRLLNEYVEDIHHELAREQNKVDSPSEYQRVSQQCDGWIDRLRLQ